MNPLDIQQKQRGLFQEQREGYDPYANLKTGFYNPGYLDLMGLGMKRMDMTLSEQRRMDQEMIVRMQENVTSAATSTAGFGFTMAADAAATALGTAIAGPLGGFVAGAATGYLTNETFGRLERKQQMSKAIRREFQGPYGERILGVGSLEHGGANLDILTDGFEEMASDDGSFSSKDLVEMASRFKNSGILQNSKDTEDFFSTFKKMKDNIKDVMENMGASLEEAQSMMVDLDRRGFNNASQTLSTMGGMANTYASKYGISKQSTMRSFDTGKNMALDVGLNSDGLGGIYASGSTMMTDASRRGEFENDAIARGARRLGVSVEDYGGSLRARATAGMSNQIQAIMLMAREKAGKDVTFQEASQMIKDGEFSLVEAKVFRSDIDSRSNDDELGGRYIEAQKMMLEKKNVNTLNGLIKLGLDKGFAGEDVGENTNLMVASEMLGLNPMDVINLKKGGFSESRDPDTEVAKKKVFTSRMIAGGEETLKMASALQRKRNNNSFTKKEVRDFGKHSTKIDGLVRSLGGEADLEKRSDMIKEFEKESGFKISKLFGEDFTTWNDKKYLVANEIAGSKYGQRIIGDEANTSVQKFFMAKALNEGINASNFKGFAEIISGQSVGNDGMVEELKRELETGYKGSFFEKHFRESEGIDIAKLFGSTFGTSAGKSFDEIVTKIAEKKGWDK